VLNVNLYEAHRAVVRKVSRNKRRRWLMLHGDRITKRLWDNKTSAEVMLEIEEMLQRTVMETLTNTQPIPYYDEEGWKQFEKMFVEAYESIAHKYGLDPSLRSGNVD
jgi:hypothetical protein